MNLSKKEHVFGVTLHRRDKNIPWGVRLVGGADLGSAILVTRVQSGSPSEKYLVRGDIIKKIGDYDARDVSHQDAQRLFLNAGTTLNLVVKRDPSLRNPTGFSSSGILSPPPTPADIPDSRRVVFPPPNPILPRSDDFFPGRSTFASDEDTTIIQNQEEYCNIGLEEMEIGFRRHTEEESAEAWPYRTTPLVLPGAKAKHEKELAPTESYLRHHPNPMMRAPPSQYELLPQEVLMKQKVADSVLQKVAGDEAFAGKQVVHKQFNTPIGLYSDQNILDTIHHQTGIPTSGALRSPFTSKPITRSVAPKKTVVYDPAKSETFKALQEEQYGDRVQEVTAPPQPKVFTPNIHGKKVQHPPPQGHTYDPMSRSTASPSLQHHLPYLNSMGHSEEHIAQSGSFKRLMNMVMGESDY